MAKTKVQAAMTAVLSVNPDYALLKISNFSLRNRWSFCFLNFISYRIWNHEQGTLLYQSIRDEEHIPMKPCLLAQVRLPSAARNLPWESTFSADLHSVCTAPVCNHMRYNICAHIKNPKRWQTPLFGHMSSNPKDGMSNRWRNWNSCIIKIYSICVLKKMCILPP